MASQISLQLGVKMALLRKPSMLFSTASSRVALHNLAVLFEPSPSPRRAVPVPVLLCRVAGRDRGPQDVFVCLVPAWLLATEFDQRGLGGRAQTLS